MSSFHHIQHAHLQPPDGRNHDRASHHLIPFFPLYDPSSSPFAYPTLSLHSSQAQACHQEEVHHQHHEDVEIPHPDGSSDPLLLVLHRPPTKDGNRDDHERGTTTTTVQQRHACNVPPPKSNNGSVKWMSSKMRLMRKMMNPDDVTAAVEQRPQRRSAQPPLRDQQAGVVRVCSDCNTTKTPLWRSGPQGPKSLCNACGIRQRKARKAMAAAAAAAAAAAVTSTGSDLKHQENKETGSDVLNHQDKAPREKCLEDGGGGGDGDDHPIVPFKKRCKYATVGATNANGLEESGLGLGKNPQLHKVFPEDEKEAAILLMALSCGLVCR